jgi:peptidoglycan/xylan/chitin deacetylase (PgdA/CDA1 family)
MLTGMIHVDRVASVFVARPLLTSGLLRTTPGIPILMYHSISDDPEPGVSPYYRVATSPVRFREQMRWLRDSGYAVIDLAEAVARLSTGKFDGRRAVVLTFDDGFRDFVTGAWPVLEEQGFTATMFLPTAFIGETRKSFKGRECLTWDEVRDLRVRGARFGSHTVNHPILYELPWTEVRRELRDARLQIEDQLQERIDTFAYPYAFPQEDLEFAKRLRCELHEQGYVGAVTTVIGRAGAVSDPLCLKRLPVNQADDRSLFMTKLAGAYDWVGSVQSIVRRTKGRSGRTRPS